MKFVEIIESKGFKNLTHKIFGFSLFFVIIGGIFLLNKWLSGIYLLNIGGIGFAFYFFFYGFYPLREELDWTLVYPELTGFRNEEDSTTEIKKLQNQNLELKNELENLKKEIEQLKKK